MGISFRGSNIFQFAPSPRAADRWNVGASEIKEKKLSARATTSLSEARHLREVDEGHARRILTPFGYEVKGRPCLKRREATPRSHVGDKTGVLTATRTRSGYGGNLSRRRRRTFVAGG